MISSTFEGEEDTLSFSLKYFMEFYNCWYKVMINTTKDEMEKLGYWI